ADFDPGHVAQAHRRAVDVGAQDDGPKLVGRCELPLHQDHRRYLLAWIARLDPDAAGRDLRVWRAYRLGHVVRGQVVPDQPVRIDPDAKRALGGIERGAADSGDAANLTENVAHQEVAEPDFVEGAVGRAQRDDLQHGTRGLLDQDALLNDRARQARLD